MLVDRPVRALVVWHLRSDTKGVCSTEWISQGSSCTTLCRSSITPCDVFLPYVRHSNFYQKWSTELRLMPVLVRKLTRKAVELIWFLYLQVVINGFKHPLLGKECWLPLNGWGRGWMAIKPRACFPYLRSHFLSVSCKLGLDYKNRFEETRLWRTMTMVPPRNLLYVFIIQFPCSAQLSQITGMQKRPSISHVTPLR